MFNDSLLKTLVYCTTRYNLTLHCASLSFDGKKETNQDKLHGRQHLNQHLIILRKGLGTTRVSIWAVGGPLGKT